MSIHIRRVIKNGNSTIVVIPPAIVRALELRFGENVALYVEDGRMLLRRLTDEELVGPRTEAAVAELFHGERN